jgi:hypothetical protein
MVLSREERAEEGKTVQHFMKLIRSKFEKSNTALEDLAKGNMGPEYQAERSLLLEVNQLGWTEGQIAGAVTFLFLRRRHIGNMVGRFIEKRRKHLPLAPRHSARPTTNAALQVVQFTLDMSLSIIAAISVSLYFTDQDKLLHTVASTPLVPGRSVVADEFCQDISREYNQIHSPEYWNQVESPILLTIQTFCRNCQLRNAYEHKLRQEQGLDHTATISIPPPGVPLDDTFQDNAYSVSEESFGFDNFEQETTIVTSQDDDWAKSLVTDQENGQGSH